MIQHYEFPLHQNIIMKFMHFNLIWPTTKFTAPIQIKGNNTPTIFLILLPILKAMRHHFMSQSITKQCRKFSLEHMSNQKVQEDKA